MLNHSVAFVGHRPHIHLLLPTQSEFISVNETRERGGEERGEGRERKKREMVGEETGGEERGERRGREEEMRKGERSERGRGEGGDKTCTIIKIKVNYLQGKIKKIIQQIHCSGRPSLRPVWSLS